jgi:hypothetical protein
MTAPIQFANQIVQCTDINEALGLVSDIEAEAYLKRGGISRHSPVHVRDPEIHVDRTNDCMDVAAVLAYYGRRYAHMMMSDEIQYWLTEIVGRPYTPVNTRLCHLRRAHLVGAVRADGTAWFDTLGPVRNYERRKTRSNRDAALHRLTLKGRRRAAEYMRQGLWHPGTETS